MSRNIWKKFSGPKLNSNPNFSSKSDEIDLEKQVHKLQHVEESCKKIIKHAKKYDESLGYLSKSEVKMMNNFSSSDLCQHEDDLRDLTESWLTASTKIDQLIPSMQNVCQKAVADPIKKYQSFFSGVYSSLKKRQNILQECQKNLEKVEKLNERDKTAQNIVKIDQAKKSLEAAKEEFEKINQVLLQDLPLLYETRIEYFQPCLEALIRQQVSFYGEQTNIVSDVNVNKEVGSMSAPTVQLIDQRLAEIKNLSIVAEDE